MGNASVVCVFGTNADRHQVGTGSQSLVINSLEISAMSFFNPGVFFDGKGNIAKNIASFVGGKYIQVPYHTQYSK